MKHQGGNMKRIAFPVIKGDITHWPDEAECPVCGQSRVCEPHSFAGLTTGAQLMSRHEDWGGPSKDMDGFLNVYWHGAHDGGQGSDPDIDATVNIVQNATGGQGELYFCSTNCMRVFLNQVVDELEYRIRELREV